MLSRRNLLACTVASFSLTQPALPGPPVYSIEHSAVGSGTVILDPLNSGYKRNNVVNVTAVPADGWRFDHWDGDLAGDVNPTTIRVSGDHSFIAYFVEAGGGGGTDPPTEPPPETRQSGLIVGYFVTRLFYI